MDILSLLAFSPVLLILVSLLLKVDLKKAAPITFLYTGGLAYAVWRMTIEALLGSTLRGVLVGFDIVLIVFGAIFFLEFLKEVEVMDSIEYYLTTISGDERVQVIILIWFFGSFLEGVAGFGTPAAIIAPLLVGLGFSPVKSVALALIGNTTAVVFGAVGTPIRVGFETVSVTGVAEQAALLNIGVGSFVPLILLGVLLYGREGWISLVKEAIPFALLSGLLVTVSTYFATFIGPEFPSLIGPLIGFFFILLALQIPFFVPKNSAGTKKKSISGSPRHSVLKTIGPYLLLVLLLGIGRVILGSIQLPLPGNIVHSVNFFNPGLLFFLTTILCTFFYTETFSSLREPFNRSKSMILAPFIVILFVAGFVEILLNTDNNLSGLGTMVEVFSQGIPTAILTVISPFIGAFGSFITGSATVSNILFGPFLERSAIETGVSHSTVLAGQVVGAGIGNMIALTNIVAAQAAVKITGEEVTIIRIVMIPVIVLSLLATGIMYFF